MTRAEFIRLAARREDAASSLRDARRSMESMTRISGPGAVCDEVDRAWTSAGNAIAELATALDVAARPRRECPACKHDRARGRRPMKDCPACSAPDTQGPPPAATKEG